MLVNGLAPDLYEVAEAVVHVAVEGHLPHTATDPCAGDEGTEHGCGTTCHQCGCCLSQSVVLHAAAPELAPRDDTSAEFAPSATSALGREPSRPFRPPIA